MRVIDWLKRLYKSERGNVLVIGAATMPLLLGSAGFAVDTIQISLMKRQLQRAADSGAVAGAFALSQGADTHNAVHNDLDKNSFPTLSGTEGVTVGARLGFQRTVRVQLTSSQNLPFMSIFTGAPTPITADATAALIQGGTFCVLSLYNGVDPGIDVGGNASLNLGCGMATNSRGPQAVTAFGSSSVSATPIMAVGGLNGGSNNFASPTTLQPYSAEQADPFASLADPPAQSCTNDVTVQPNDPSTPLEPGCFKSLDIKGTATLSPGVYYINGGDLSFGSQANVTGSEVTFVMTGTNGLAGDLIMNAQATLNLTAPTSGVYENILFYRDRRASNIEIKINGGSTADLTGAFYFPSSDITFTGNAGLKVNCLQMVGQLLKFRGTSTINNSCSRPGSGTGFQLSYVRLVG